MKIFSLAAIQMQNKAGTVLTQASKKEKKKKRERTIYHKPPHWLTNYLHFKQIISSAFSEEHESALSDNLLTQKAM